MLKKILAVLAMLCATLAMAAVDVNKATEAELDAVKGIGPVTSKLIMSERKKGEFKSWQDFIDRVKGVGDSRAAKLSAEGLTVGGAAYRVTAASDRKPAKDSKADTKTAGEKAKDTAAKAVDKTKEVAKDAKDKVTGDKTAKAEAAKPAASAAKK